MMKTRSDRPLLLTAVFAVMATAPASAVIAVTPAAAQTGPEIMQQMIDRHRERLSGIESLLIEQEMMGIETTIYMAKEMIDGKPTLVPVTTTVAGMNVSLEGAAFIDAWTGSARVYGQWAERFRLDGTDDIDGRPVYSLAVDDFTGIDLGVPPGQDIPLTPLSGLFYVDQSDLVMLRMEIEMEATTDTGESRVVTFASTLEDYREVDGYLHPFLTSISFGDLMSSAVGGVDLAEVARQLEQLEQRLADIPPDQRDMVERMIQPMRVMLSGAPLEIIVTRLEANVAPPGGR